MMQHENVTYAQLTVLLDW